MCKNIRADVEILKSACAMRPKYQVLERDIDVVLKGDLIATEPLDLDGDLEVVEICEYAGLMAAINALG